MAALWAFPKFWYTKTDSGAGYFWFADQKAVDGWTYEDAPVSKSAEAVLVADALSNGQFDKKGTESVRVFSAKRYAESQNEIGLFVHTPDRCWTETGWTMEAAVPDHAEVDLHGIRMTMERRIFSRQGHRELVYFGALVGGQPLPYRLDHNMSVGMRYSMRSVKNEKGAGLRLGNELFWTRVWDSFTARRQLAGPKQFVRISTAVTSDDASDADKRLAQFLPLWLQPVDYQKELAAWTQTDAAEAKKAGAGDKSN